MQIIDYSNQHSTTVKKQGYSNLLETITATMIFVLPALLLFILASN